MACCYSVLLRGCGLLLLLCCSCFCSHLRMTVSLCCCQRFNGGRALALSDFVCASNDSSNDMAITVKLPPDAGIEGKIA